MFRRGNGCLSVKVELRCGLPRTGSNCHPLICIVDLWLCGRIDLASVFISHIPLMPQENLRSIKSLVVFICFILCFYMNSYQARNPCEYVLLRFFCKLRTEIYKWSFLNHRPAYISLLYLAAKTKLCADLPSLVKPDYKNIS